MANRIIHVVQHLRPGGIESLALELVRVSRDADVHIVSLEGSAEETIGAWPRLTSFASRLHFLDKAPGWSLSALFNLNKLIRTIDPVAVHTHHIGPLIYGGIAARLRGVPSVLHTEHDAWHLDSPKRKHLQSVILKIVRPLIIADSKAVSTALKRHFPRQAQILIYNGIDTDRFSPQNVQIARQTLDLPSDVKLIGCAARLEEVKGQDVLIRALAQMSDEFHVAFAGTGSLLANYEKLAAELQLTNRIRFLGNVDNMHDFYNAIDVFCLPSRNEGLPLSPLEAQSCNRPAVASKVGGTDEAICPLTGKLVTAEDPTALAEALTTVVNNTGEKPPRNFVLDKFSLSKMADAYTSLAVRSDSVDAGSIA